MPQAATIGTTAHSEHIHPEKLCPFCILGPLILHVPHIVEGPVTSGSTDVLINNLPAARVQDVGLAVPCCNTNVFAIVKGSATVFINGRPAARIGDTTQHCSLYPGVLVNNGSPNVIIGSEALVPGLPGLTIQGPPAPSSDAIASTSEPPLDAPSEKESEPPRELKPLDWKLVYSDGQPVKDFTCRVLSPAAEKEHELAPDGQGHCQEGKFEPGASYSVTFVGLRKAQGVVQSEDGKPAKGVRLLLERAFGPAHELITGGSGRLEVSGLVKDEPYDVTVVDDGAAAVGCLVDEQGRPMAGVQLIIQQDSGKNQLLTTDGAGRFRAAGLLRTEGYSLTVVQLADE